MNWIKGAILFKKSPLLKILLAGGLTLSFLPCHSAAAQALPPPSAGNNVEAEGQISLQGMLATANELIENGFFDQAIAIYEGAIKLYPEKTDIKKKLAWLYAWNKQYKKSIALFKVLIKKNPRDRALQKDIAQIYAWDHKYKIAIALYRHYLNRYPDDLDALKGLAQVYAWKGDFNRSIKLYRKALFLAPNDKEVRQGLAQVLTWKGATKEAEDQYEQLLSMDPNDISTYRDLGTFFARNRDFSRAYRYFRQAIRLAPDDPDNYVGLANIAMWERKYGLAKQNYLKALNIRRNYSPALEGLRSLRLAKSLVINVGLEEDYLSDTYYFVAYYPLWQKQDIEVDYSYLDRTYYFRKRSRVSLQNYFTANTRLKVAVSQAQYSYPDSINPDNTALTRSDDIKLQFKAFLSNTWQVRLSYRYARTQLFHWPEQNGNVHFAEFSLTKRWSRWLQTEFGYAMLRDFDPNTADTLQYKQFKLFHGALGIQPVRSLRIELRYIPNRDLDNTIKQTFIADAKWQFVENVTLWLRFRHDEYRKGYLVDEYLTGLSLPLFYRHAIRIAYKRINGERRSGNYMFVNLLTRF